MFVTEQFVSVFTSQLPTQWAFQKVTFRWTNEWTLWGLPLLALSMARKLLQNFKTLRMENYLQKKKTPKNSGFSIFLISSQKSFPHTRTCLFVPAFFARWLLINDGISMSLPQSLTFPKSWMKTCSWWRFCLSGRDTARGAAPGRVEPSPEQGRGLQGLPN